MISLMVTNFIMYFPRVGSGIELCRFLRIFLLTYTYLKRDTVAKTTDSFLHDLSLLPFSYLLFVGGFSNSKRFPSSLSSSKIQYI